MKILALGDVVGPAGLAAAASGLRPLKRELGADIVIVNAENAYISNGLDVRSATVLLESGADVLTGGNHSLRIHDSFDMYDENDFVLRPHNYPAAAPGKGYTLFQTGSGVRVLVMSLVGQVFMDGADAPFNCAEALLGTLKGQYDIAVADFHGEATSEKYAFFHNFDGRISVMYGTHTHVQTADEGLLPKGSGYITDLGMCGVTTGVLGVKPETVISNYTSKIHHRFEKAEGPTALCGALFTVDEKSGIVKEVKRIRKDYPA
ncbi:MAG: YmdB family metallophosphoesterase [Clostridia bacterium]|nr:YmdB family metallophosphoesterase [Clostridia bacterium]